MRGPHSSESTTYPSVILTLLTLLLAVAIVPSSLQAQTDYSSRKASTRLSAGVGASGGIALVTGTLPKGVESAPGFAYRVGLNLQYPINRTIGIQFNTGLDSRSYGRKRANVTDADLFTGRYFFIEPGLSWSSFRLSVNIGLPLGGTEPLVDTVANTVTYPDMASDALGTMIEPRIGATLVMIDDKSYWLGLTVDAGLAVSSFYDEAYRTSHNISTESVEAGRGLTGHLGVTYQFSIPVLFGK